MPNDPEDMRFLPGSQSKKLRLVDPVIGAKDGKGETRFINTVAVVGLWKRKLDGVAFVVVGCVAGTIDGGKGGAAVGNK
ncbi:hypothetical protein Nepgr_029372 [Nepenthes gracilis]|uniref:Uncharacterized protein n=1 Tax=Nepenthes gracilis TaxID=150966 RepID=A0AAD3TEE8_NEPGR|nr:hypothetical protein Nepgr_029372 [Nepenthes gracilis]